jgi:hypothetical protein
VGAVRASRVVEDDRFLIFNWLTMTPIVSFEMKPPPAKCAVRSFTSSVSTFLVLANLSLTRPSIAEKATGLESGEKRSLVKSCMSIQNHYAPVGFRQHRY